MKSEKRIWIIFVVASIMAILLLNQNPTQPRYVYSNISECEALTPQEAPLIRDEYSPTGGKINVKLDFSKKENLALGKYGFRKTLEITEPTILEQEVLLASWEKNIFGIFTDPELNKPLKRVSVGEQLRIENAIEMGASMEEYSDRPDYIAIVLEPGTYYLAAYSTDEKDSKTAVYQSRIASIETEYILQEGEWKYFFDAGKGQKTYFSIHVDEPATLEVEREQNIFNYDVILCDSEKKPIRKAVVLSNKPKTKIEVSQAGDYFLEVSTGADEPTCWSYGIRYRCKLY